MTCSYFFLIPENYTCIYTFAIQKEKTNENSKFYSIYYFVDAFKFFNEDIVLKMFLLYNEIVKNIELFDIITSMKMYLSNKMISNLFVKIPFFNENNDLQDLLEDLEEDELAKFVKENMKKINKIIMNVTFSLPCINR